MFAKVSSKLTSKSSPSGLKLRVIAPLFIVIATSINACTITTSPTVSSPSTTTTTAKNESLPLVVATNSVICDIAKQIAGETINLKCLIEAGTDPHLYQPKPEDRKAIDSAKLVLYGGYDFEPNLIKLIQASSNPVPKIAVNEIAIPKPLIATEGHTHEHKEDQKSAKSAKEADPHVWNDAQNGIKIAQTINKNLIMLRPDQADTYNQNTTKLVSELEQIDSWIKAQIATIPVNSRKLVTTHEALGYLQKPMVFPLKGL